MKNEIKETINWLNQVIKENKENDVSLNACVVPFETLYKLQDYITNLQKENESLIKNKNKAISSLKFILDNWTWALECHYIENVIKTLNGRIEFDDVYIYKSRNKKANDYINSTDFIYDEQYKKKYKLENILNGGDE